MRETSPRHMYTLFFFNDTATTEIYTLSLHDALPILLDSLEIDYLGVSTDSIMLILPGEYAKQAKSALEKITPVFEVGYVTEGRGAAIITEDGPEEELKPLFRESAYTRVKKVIGETSPEDLEKMSTALDKAKREAIEKKNEITEWMAKRE